MKTTRKLQKKKSSGSQINEKMTFAEVIQNYPETAEVFFKNGMSCFGCPAAMMESLEYGIKAHGQDPKKIIGELNKVMKSRKK